METLATNFQCMMLDLLLGKAIPKGHYYWCMRYEGAHLYFKKIAIQSYNFKNIPKTLAQRQQLRQCFSLSKCQFLKIVNESRGNKIIHMHEIDSKVKLLLNQRYGLDFVQSDQTFIQCCQLIYNHIIYKQHAVYVYDVEYALSTPDDSILLVIDDKEDEQHEDENDTTQSSVNSSVISTKITTQDTPKELSFPNEYLLPVLPNQVNDAISLKQMYKFEKLCNFRSIIIDDVFHDLKNKYNLLYPTRAQYTIIVNGILNHLNVELETKKVNSWRESLISKHKRERQNSNDERRVEIKLKYSRETSGRKIKQRPITEISERNIVNKILLAENISSNNEQMAAKSEIIKEDFQNSSFDYENLKQLWLETYEYRQSFINQNSIADVMEQFPAYSNPLMVLTDVKILKGIDLDNSVKEKLDLLADKICSGNQYITDSSSIRCFKVLCGILNDSWKHYIYFHPEPKILINLEQVRENFFPAL
ncbi:unnamed protein product [Adineta steineri]|uniref:Uncharacterized protein n=1 Tax=Adineta steineri TaxID=433720 RepID=A0A819RPU2_9BILA|nr:unnamed protein product [Adineta steineri]